MVRERTEEMEKPPMVGRNMNKVKKIQMIPDLKKKDKGGKGTGTDSKPAQESSDRENESYRR